jgi:hypothetical protein
MYLNILSNLDVVFWHNRYDQSGAGKLT